MSFHVLKTKTLKSCDAFSLPELMISLAIGFGVIAATASAYLFFSKNGKAVEWQIDFSNKYRALYSRFTDLVEKGSKLEIDDSNHEGVYINLPEYPDAWIGYVNDGSTEGDSSLSNCKIVYRREGKNKSGNDPEEVLCTHVSPVDSSSPMFRILGNKTVILNVNIGDNSSYADTTGPGYQGLSVSIVCSCRNLRERKLGGN